MSITRFRVAICGGGIGGLTLAVALSRFPDIQVDVYEAAERFREIGAGVMIWERTWKILNEFGLSSEFSKIAHAPPDGTMGVGFNYRKSDQSQEGFQFYLFSLPYGCIRFHRAHFLDVLVDHLPSGVAHFGKRLLSYKDSGPDKEILLSFADGTQAECDLLIGCDGIKSVVREQMLQQKARQGHPELLQCIDPLWSGSIAYRGLIPLDRLSRQGCGQHRTIEDPMMYCGKNKHVVSYAIANGNIINVVAMTSHPELEGSPYEGPWVTDCAQDELLQCFSGWEPEVIEMLKCVEKPTRWAIHQLSPLPLYTLGRVALLGDAAHAMTPHQGAGAGQAIEDAYILAGLIGHPSTTLERAETALRAYETVRLPLANHVLNGSRESGLMYEFNGVQGDDLHTLGPAIGGQWDWLNQTTPEGELQRAVQLAISRASPVGKVNL